MYSLRFPLFHGPPRFANPTCCPSSFGPPRLVNPMCFPLSRGPPSVANPLCFALPCGPPIANPFPLSLPPPPPTLPPPPSPDATNVIVMPSHNSWPLATPLPLPFESPAWAKVERVKTNEQVTSKTIFFFIQCVYYALQH